jgi:hypothetical protein
MKYMLLIYQTEGAESGLSEQELGAYFGKWGAFDAEARAKTTVLDGAPLEGVATATTVRTNGGKSVLSDGPFAETKEQLGGFYLIDAKDLDEATSMAGMMPHLAYGGSVEVRPVRNM